MSALVTVIIPSYNCEAYIAETINSVLAQSYPSIELIIVDDGSTDKTQDIIRSYGNKLKLISQDNAGVCVARNRGIQEATGEYICLLDHDDFWYPDKISQQVKAFQTFPENGVVYSSFALWFPDSNNVFPSPESFGFASVGNEIDQTFSGWIYHLLLLDSWVLTSTAMFRTEVFKKCGLFDVALPYSEDWDLWLRIAREYPYLKLQATTTLYRQHPHQGNKKIRDIDYRTELLINAKNKWGLCGPDGQCLSKWKFNRQLADYHAAYGLHHLQAGSKKSAVNSFLEAWRTYPFKLKYIAYIFASGLGWKPKW